MNNVGVWEIVGRAPVTQEGKCLSGTLWVGCDEGDGVHDVIHDRPVAQETRHQSPDPEPGNVLSAMPPAEAMRLALSSAICRGGAGGGHSVSSRHTPPHHPPHIAAPRGRRRQMHLLMALMLCSRRSLIFDKLRRQLMLGIGFEVSPHSPCVFRPVERAVLCRGEGFRDR